MKSIEADYSISDAFYFEWALLFLSIFLIFNYIYSLRKNCIKKGVIVDYKHFILGFYFVLPYFVLYPFSAALPNILAAGNAIYDIQDTISLAFSISALGYLSTLVGCYFYERNILGKYFNLIHSKVNDNFRFLMLVSVEKVVARIFSILSLFVSIISIVAIWAGYGFTTNIREIALANELLRPFYNMLFGSLLPFSLTITLIVYLEGKKRFDLFLFISLVVCSVFSGSRSSIIFPLVFPILLYLMFLGDSFRFRHFLLIASSIVFVFFLLDFFRGGGVGDVSPITVLLLSFFYGNNFSDLRDFAWILAYWDKEPFGGWTYLAAFLSFIPRSLIEFRETWSLSMVTNSIVGFDSSIHAGLRPGRFGEAYFNFSSLGVIIIGFFGGVALSYCNKLIWSFSKLDKSKKPISKMYSATFVYTFYLNLYVTSGFWGFYMLVLLLFSCCFIFFIIKPFRTRRSPHGL